MNCPKCEDAKLIATTVREVEVDRCPDCRGVWFDENELAQLTRLTTSELRSLQSQKVDESHNSKRGDCPRDGEAMLRVISPRNESVVIDTCVKCGGIWLDDGELAKIAKA